MNQYKVKSGQNIYDIAIELHGTVEGIFDLLISNPGLTLNAELHSGNLLNYNEEFMLNSDITSWFLNNNAHVKNGNKTFDIADNNAIIRDYIQQQYPSQYGSLYEMSPDEKNEFWNTLLNPRLIVKQQGKESSFIAKIRPNLHMFIDWGDYAGLQIISGKSLNAYKSMIRKTTYLYLSDYIELDYDYAKQYFYHENPYIPPFGCSSLRNGNWYGRNFDWLYLDSVEFVVRTPHNDGRKAVIGVASNIAGINRSLVEGREYNEIFKVLPFYLVDGVNEDGVFCNINVVPCDKGMTEVTEPDVQEQERLCVRMLPRFILDNFGSATDAVNYIRDYVGVYMPSSTQSMGYEIHLMIGDSTSTYVMEFIDSKTVIHEHDKMTNFYIDGVTFNADGKVYTPADVNDGHLPSVENGITEYGSGLERYNLIVDNIDSANSLDGMHKLMNKLTYTNTYEPNTDPFWYSEYVTSQYGITVDTPNDDNAMQAAVVYGIEAFKNRERGTIHSDTWHSSHSSIYDLKNKRLYLISQEENDNEMVFDLLRYDSDDDSGEIIHCYSDNGSHEIRVYGDFECDMLDLTHIGGVYYPLAEIYADEFYSAIQSEEINRLIITEQ